MKKYLSKIFYQITEDLDLTEAQEKIIKNAYESVAKWLNQEGTALSKYGVDIYPQGSNKIGTVVKPLKTDDYDIDIVCLLKNNTFSLTPKQVKQLVGERLKESDKFRQMLLPEKKRCWTLQYADNLNFHMDILPAIPNMQEVIKATHKNFEGSYSFFATNPHGYAEWFRRRMQRDKRTYASEHIEPIPNYPHKTILQKVIQLLKRHRDVMFLDDQDDAPASIIITTLAGQIYNNESDLAWLFEKTICDMESNIEKRDDGYWVKNPVNHSENFADKWKTEPNKQVKFFEWLHKIKDDYERLMSSSTKEDLLNNLYSMFGQGIIDKGNRELGGYDVLYENMVFEPRELLPYKVQMALSVSHRQRPPWKLPLLNIIQLQVTVKDGSYEHIIASSEPVEKYKLLEFKAIHGIQKPYGIKWQVTNTGEEATLNNDLRGLFYTGGSSDVWTEHTRYSGIHYVQCFIIKDGKCVAKSREFIVQIL